MLTVGGLDTAKQKLQTLLYKDATYWLDFESGQRYRLIPGTAAQPHLLAGAGSPAWWGNRLPASSSRVRIDRSHFAALGADTFELDFACLATM